jgi:peptide-methionine (S)-S-oxide reductase
MDGPTRLDELFCSAVAAIDAGDVAGLDRLVAAHPALVRQRLDEPGAWLRDKVGGALDGFFQKPYLLWFVAEDPVRNARLPANIADVTRAIIRAARREGVETLQEQLEHALRLVSWSWIARDCNVQIDLIDALIDAGASPDGNPDNALVNGNFGAARHLVERGRQFDVGDGALPGTLGRRSAPRAYRERPGQAVRVHPCRSQGEGRRARQGD